MTMIERKSATVYQGGTYNQLRNQVQDQLLSSRGRAVIVEPWSRYLRQVVDRVTAYYSDCGYEVSWEAIDGQYSLVGDRWQPYV